MSQQGLQETLTNSLSLVRWSYSNFVDPKLRCGFIWVQIDNRAYKSNNKIIIQRNYQAMARVIEKFLCSRLYNWIVKNVYGDIVEVMRIRRTEKFNFKHKLLSTDL